MSHDNGSASESTPLLLGSSPSRYGIGTGRGVAIGTGIGMLVLLQSTIASELDAYELASWFTTAFLVTMSSFTPLMGRLSQVFSPRMCIFYSTIILALGSVITSLSWSFTTFVIGRAITGFGGAGIVAVSIIIVIEIASPKRRGIYVGLLNMGYSIGISVGAVAAGALLPAIGWRALFWGQAPLAILSCFILLFGIPRAFTKNYSAGKESRSLVTKLKGLDYLGGLTLVLSITALLIGLSDSKISHIPILLFLLLMPLFVFTEIYLAEDPIIPVVVLKSRGVLLTCLATLGFMTCRWSVLFYTPVYSIAVRGWSPALAGAILIPTNVGFALGGLVVGFIHIRREGSFYLATLMTVILFPVTIFILCLATTPTMHPEFYVAATFCNGLCVGAALNYSLAHILHLAPKETHFIVSSLLGTIRGFAGSFGSAVSGGVFAHLLHGNLEDGFERAGMNDRKDLIRKLMGSPATVRELEGVERTIAVDGYVDALRGLFGAAAGLAAVFILAQAGVGWRGHGEKLLGEDEEGIAVTEPIDENEPIPL